ncbi:probable DNA-directed RNA polymerases I and III subunit RPAC2 [Ooceraea biroi]|uniref:DNA-directed RNA polymerase I subunit D n=1 Tax=Ooceraea biroi TaxID=2015173 RepID=A0A026W2U5_OOCBI|nr:probable DNA-directed RNA polymerases I and III subunit RPAC2 [Ooceraea biroi]EZA50397.1 putative DNA-directed RNA polymerases I and III subunit RPAC2 [Ooceraea biroi]
MGRLLKLPEKHAETTETFVFLEEGHTLGNALSAVIRDYPSVQLCGYTVPHPAENKINFRIQTTGENATEVLRRGLEDLEKICDITIERFEKAYENFKVKDTSMDTT